MVSLTCTSFISPCRFLGPVIADVSGKGVPAALFMIASKIILQSVAMLDKSPAEILKKTNEAICSNNEAEMFVCTDGVPEATDAELQLFGTQRHAPSRKK